MVDPQDCPICERGYDAAAVSELLHVLGVCSDECGATVARKWMVRVQHWDGLMFSHLRLLAGAIEVTQ